MPSRVHHMPRKGLPPHQAGRRKLVRRNESTFPEPPQALRARHVQIDPLVTSERSLTWNRDQAVNEQEISA